MNSNTLHPRRLYAKLKILLIAVMIIGTACDESRRVRSSEMDSPDQSSFDMSSTDLSSIDMNSKDQSLLDMGSADMDTVDMELNSEELLRCDPLQESHCALPWPSDHFLRADLTGKPSLSFSETSLPQNREGVHITPEPLKRLDGYGLLATGIAYFENLNPSQLPSELEIEQSLGQESRVILVDLGPIGQESDPLRLPCWAELDLRVSEDLPRALFIRPARLLEPSHRYAYVLIDLIDNEGQAIVSSPAFASLRDGEGVHPTGDPLITEERRAHFETLFVKLEGLGIDREKITLAWTFQTASRESLTAPLVHMRDQGLGFLDQEGFNVSIEEVIEFRHPDEPPTEGDTRQSHRYIAAELRGSISVPNFMESDGFLNGEYQLRRDQEGKPSFEGLVEAPFWLRIPHVALSGEPMGLIIYGHGQLYSGAEVQMADKGPVAQEGGYLYLGTDMWGMSEKDLITVPLTLSELGRFRAISERLHQGVFNTLALARFAKSALMHQSWLTEKGVHLDPHRIVYGGISQGAIFGATILALSQDITRGHLGVPGLHYFTLIGRSKNFSGMFSFLSVAYPDPIDRWIALASAQLLWNHTDPSTYYRHLNFDPLPNTPTHQALLTPAQGDPQVSQLTIEHLSRSELNFPILVPYGEQLPPLAQSSTYPHLGSGIVAWHYSPRTPIGAAPAPEDHYDPHEDPRRDPLHNQQMIHFWETGEVIDTCGGSLCGPWRPE